MLEPPTAWGNATRFPCSPEVAVQPPAERVSTSTVKLEDVGGPLAPPRSENDLGREVTCSPDEGAAAEKEAETESERLCSTTGAEASLNFDSVGLLA